MTNLPPDQARTAAAQILATRPSSHWNDSTARIAPRLQLSTTQAQRDLIPAANTWVRDPRLAAHTQLDQVADVRTRMQDAALKPPTQRWASLARELDARPPHEADWPALAQLLDQAHAEGHNVPAVTRQLIADRPLAEQPAQDLRYRLVATHTLTINASEAVPATPPAGSAKERQVAPNASATPVSPPRR
ncbi:MAG: hypothetical protein M3Y49_12125 [Actinomycetota bacterium]|nr:hypothetical protein [Actinomycetota bacterium]